MKGPSQRISSIFWHAFLVLPVLATLFFPQLDVAAEPPSDKELSAMGQGFGKFVGSFMGQLQSNKMQEMASPERRAPRRSAPHKEEDVFRQEYDDDQRSRPHTRREETSRQRKTAERRRTPYQFYDPWGASYWGDPHFGFDPWESRGSWVDRDWHRRKRQYGWSYGRDRYFREKRYPRERRHPDRRGYPEEAWLSSGRDRSPREQPWDAPFNFGWYFGFGGQEGSDYDRAAPPEDRYARPGDVPRRYRAPYDSYDTYDRRRSMDYDQGRSANEDW